MKLLTRIVACLDDRTIRVQVSNGHTMVGIVPRVLEKYVFPANFGNFVLLSVSQVDMSKGVVAVDN